MSYFILRSAPRFQFRLLDKNFEFIYPSPSYGLVTRPLSTYLTFKNRASYIQDGHTPVLSILHFIYFFNKYKY